MVSKTQFLAAFNWSSMKNMDSVDGDIPLFWQTGIRQIPPRPDNPGDFPEDDDRHWYDLEYSGWRVSKLPGPESPADGPKGKSIVGLISGTHPYSDEFREGMRRTAAIFGIDLKIFTSQWNSDQQIDEVKTAIELEPDLIIIWIENINSGTELIGQIYDAGIPVIAANALPDDEGFRRIVAWTGPDDWTQFRLLSGRFAELMENEGGYAIVCHMESTSAYYARSWSVITELKKVAPKMEMLAMASTNLDRNQTYEQVKEWLQIYGPRLKGIVSADDNITQLGINQALAESGRNDVIRVASGSTPTGINLVREGGVQAITYQLAEQDGALPIKVAVDWFNGLEISPIRHLPVRILDESNIDLLVDRKKFVIDADTDLLYQAILDCKTEPVHRFFRELTEGFSRSTDVSMEFFRGFCIEAYANLHHIIKTANLDAPSIVGNYEGIFKMLFQQPSMEKSLKWLENISLSIVSQLSIKRNRHSHLVDQVITHVKDNYHEPLSLKTLSHEFKITAPYLGKLFSDETGETFTIWLNKLRIEKAIELMKTTDLTIREIALKTGYVNSNYFYKLFKKYMGVNPGEYQSGLNTN